MRSKKLYAVLMMSVLLTVVGREGQAALPQNYQEFKARYQQEGRTPEGAVKLYFEAVFCYIDEATRAEGSKMLRYALHYDRPIEQSYNLTTFVERLRDPEMHHIFRGFAEGTSPENDYRMSPDNFNLVVGKKVQEQGYLRVFLQNSGADSPRSVWMKEFDGLWYMINNAGTYVQVRPPKAFIDRTKNAHDADYDAAETPKEQSEANAGNPSEENEPSPTPDPSDKGESTENDEGLVFK
ncbi:hypothetical protein [uncultured Fretibacterium sp.]|uniref:DUF6935 domain-containing protein n=1 Tax=uncultured Fretibacterium sp. TaxID=1678694 RepID=UPI00261974D1|nr:hypothetical protein [uncultured Fretibacterium sp.]